MKSQIVNHEDEVSSLNALTDKQKVLMIQNEENSNHKLAKSEAQIYHENEDIKELGQKIYFLMNQHADFQTIKVNLKLGIMTNILKCKSHQTVIHIQSV